MAIFPTTAATLASNNSFPAFEQWATSQGMQPTLSGDDGSERWSPGARAQYNLQKYGFDASGRPLEYLRSPGAAVDTYESFFNNMAQGVDGLQAYNIPDARRRELIRAGISGSPTVSEFVPTMMGAMTPEERVAVEQYQAYRPKDDLIGSLLMAGMGLGFGGLTGLAGFGGGFEALSGMGGAAELAINAPVFAGGAGGGGSIASGAIGGATMAGGSGPGGLLGWLANLVPGQGGLEEVLKKYGLQQGGPLSALTHLGSSLIGMKSSRDIAAAGREAAARMDPFGPYRPQYAGELSALMANPSSITSRPGYQAGLEAVERRMASQGYLGSGNMMAALADYGGNFFDREVGRLSGLAGANFGPSGGNLLLTGETAAADTLSRALGSLGFGMRDIERILKTL